VELSGAIIAPGAAPQVFDSIKKIWFRYRDANEAMLAAQANPSIGGQIGTRRISSIAPIPGSSSSKSMAQPPEPLISRRFI
jgi:hypothetical protein